RALVAALPLAHVVRDVGHEVGVAAVGPAHHAVLVVTEIGGPQPQRAAVLVGVAVGAQGGDGLLDLAIGIQRAFQEVDVEADAVGSQVAVLLAAQPGEGAAAARGEVVGARGASADGGVGVDAGAVQSRLGDVGNIVAA